MNNKEEKEVKEIKMEVVNKKGADEKKPVQEKMSYEALENIAHQLSDQSRDLYGKWQQSEAEKKELQHALSAINRADYLFKVLQYDYAFAPEFVNKCVAELQEFLTIPEEKEEDTTNKEEDKNNG